jgi:hypothetical protein
VHHFSTQSQAPLVRITDDAQSSLIIDAAEYLDTESVDRIKRESLLIALHQTDDLSRRNEIHLREQQVQRKDPMFWVLIAVEIDGQQTHSIQIGLEGNA